MTPEDVISILHTISKFYSESFAGISAEEAKEALDYAMNAVRQESYRNLDSKYGINSSTKIQADNFFGYDDDQFFTRDDEIDYIETPLYDRYESLQQGRYSNSFRAYIDKNQLEVDWSVDGYEGTAKATVDFRKIRKPSDLSKYLSIIEQQIDEELLYGAES